MANLFEHKDRRVVPNWRSFENTTILGELNSFQKNEENYTKHNLEDYILDWKFNKTLIHAGDLIGAAIVNNLIENPFAKEAATFILQNKSNATKSQISLANKILNKSEIIDLSNNFKLVTLDNIGDLISPELIQKKIKETKFLINNYPYNGILYVELSRFYSILGNKVKAINSMKAALHLTKNNRFVLRSAARLFVHFHELDIAHDILKRSSLTHFDPWLTSAEIAIATIKNKPSHFIKKGIELINSKNISPFNFTELASSIGTLEILNGNRKKSREFFNKALLKPNDNTLAQIEWAILKDNHLNLNQTEYNLGLNFEALAIDNFQNSNYEKAIDNVTKWFIDMPFSKRPIMFGSNLASTILKDQEKSISFLNAGLSSHPNDPQLINNMAYALSLDNRPSEALEYLHKIKYENNIDEMTRICILATKGLTFFRSGFADEGRKMYMEAIDNTNQAKMKDLNWIAILNYAREEIRINSEYVEPIIEIVQKIPKQNTAIEVSFLRSDIINQYDKLKASNI